MAETVSGTMARSGDDCAVFQLEPGREMAVSTDQCLEGAHFPTGMPADMLGYRCLAAALSDLAAVGARPLGFTLALGAPELEPTWVRELARGCGELTKRFGLLALGGDLVRSPCISLVFTVFGDLPEGQALLRSGARSGDRVFVSGCLGDAALGLAQLASGGDYPPLRSPRKKDYALWRYCYPQPRIELGDLLLGVASAAIDISDGFLADLGHLLASSSCGALIDPGLLPLSRTLQAQSDGLALALTGGDDYELCFTVPEESIPALEKQLAAGEITEVGVTESTSGMRFPEGFVLPESAGYRHFD